MLDPIFDILLNNGIGGVVAALFIWLYLDEKKKSRVKIDELNEKLQDTLSDHSDAVGKIISSHSNTLNEIYAKQNKREEELTQTFQDYGQSVVDAVNHTHELVDRIYRIRK